MKIYEVRHGDQDGIISEFFDNRRAAVAGQRLWDGLAELYVHEVKPTRKDIVRLMNHLCAEA